MKNLILIGMCILFAHSVSAQADKKVTETTFWVDGVCEMCKNRIEGAVMRTNGVKLANWDVNTHELTVVYKNSKTSDEELHQVVNSVGHDTKLQKASDETYEKIHPCCKYRDEEVMEEHNEK